MLPRSSILALVLALTACGARELPVPAPTATAALAKPAPSATPGPTASAAQASSGDDDEYEAALAHRKEGAEAEHGALTAFVTAHPGSPHLSDAYAALGDVEFGESAADPARMVAAKKYYEAALATPPATSRVYGYAAYKLAYVHWNLGDFDNALAMFKRAIDFGAAHPEVQGATKLRDTALRDVVSVYAIAGAPTKAFPFFRVLAGEDARALVMLESLARTYDETGKFTDAKTTAADLRRRDPAHQCKWDVLERNATPSSSRAAIDAELAKCPP